MSNVSDMYYFIAKRIQLKYSRKPAKSHIEDIIEELGIFPRSLGTQARFKKANKCPKSLRLLVMSEITFLHAKGII